MAGLVERTLVLVEPVVRAIVAAVLADQMGRDDVQGIPYVDESAEVVLRKLSQMPVFLGSGMKGVTLAFDASSVATHGRRFRALTLPEQKRQLRQWRGAKVGILKDFVSFYEKMGVFAYYNFVEEAKGLHHGAGLEAK